MLNHVFCSSISGTKKICDERNKYKNAVCKKGIVTPDFYAILGRKNKHGHPEKFILTPETSFLQLEKMICSQNLTINISEELLSSFIP
jgi:hypothetical protein